MRTKYPRTFHLPWSEGMTSDDKKLSDVSFINDGPIVITEKMDGENTTLYNDYIHARSLDSKSHWTQDWVRQFHASIKHDIPNAFRICGENVFAKHSIEYSELETYFYGFGIWLGDFCLSWSDTMEYFELLGITPVPVIFYGTWKDMPEKIHDLWNKDEKFHEGYVVRSAHCFHKKEFSTKVGKYVRKNHVQTDEHWKSGNIIKNSLK